MRYPRCVIYTIEEGYFLSQNTTNLWCRLLFILTTCFGPYNVPSSGHKTYI